MAKAGSKGNRAPKNSKNKTPKPKTKEAKANQEHPKTKEHVSTGSEYLWGMNDAQKAEWMKKELGMNKSQQSKAIDAVKAYTGEAAYAGIHNNESAYKSQIETIDAMIHNPKMPIYDGTTYRGMIVEKDNNLNAEAKVEAILKSGTWNEPGITSFSSDKKVAKKYTNIQNPSSGDVAILLVNKKNKTGVPIRHLSEYPNESEVLYPSDIKNRGFKIVKYTKTKRTKNKSPYWEYVVEVEEND